MSRLKAILIGATIFASVYGGALANEHRPDRTRSIPIVYVVTKPVGRTVAHAIPKPKPARSFTSAGLSSDQRVLYYALLSASCDAIRGCKK